MQAVYGFRNEQDAQQALKALQ